MKNQAWRGHTAMAGANMMWGMMSPVSKMVMAAGIVSPLAMTSFRMWGAALLFWIVSSFTKREKVTPDDMRRLFFAALLGIVLNQGSFIFGVGLTSPVNASIITTSTPIITMIIAALYLKEPITGKKVGGIALGLSGALLLILGGQAAASGKNANIWGDLLCFAAQLSFSTYIVVYKGLISRYSPITLMKWMFTYASLCVIPFSVREVASLEWTAVGLREIAGIAFVVGGGTFVSYLLVPVGQRILRPTVASMYNYVQPVVAGIVAIAWGMDSFSLLKLAAILLIFSGVFLVTRSRAKR